MPLLFSLNPFAVVAQATFLFVSPNPAQVCGVSVSGTGRGLGEFFFTYVRLFTFYDGEAEVMNPRIYRSSDPQHHTCLFLLA